MQAADSGSRNIGSGGGSVGIGMGPGGSSIGVGSSGSGTTGGSPGGTGGSDSASMCKYTKTATAAPPLAPYGQQDQAGD